jgi:opine dehydrogenase
MSCLARQIGVETPTINAIIQLASVLMNRDYAAEAMRTPESLGIADLSASALVDL